MKGVVKAALPGTRLADLYDPDLMPPNLRRAHQALDRAVDYLYRRMGSLPSVSASNICSCCMKRCVCRCGEKEEKDTTEATTESLFKAVPELQGAIMNGETTFEFLQRGGRTEAIEICQWIENWFRAYPDDHKDELRMRLQSKKFEEFMGAYFELQIFSGLRQLDCDVEVHPTFLT